MLVSLGPWGRPALSGDLGTSSRSRSVDLLPRATRAQSEGPQCRPAVPDITGQCPRARGVDQLSWATRTLVRGPRFEQLSHMIRGRARGSAVSTPCPGRLTLRLLREVPQGRPGVTGDLGPDPRACGVDELSQEAQDSE